MKRKIYNLTVACLITLISANAIAQDKKVAMLESIAMTDGISSMVKNMVRGELTKQLSLDPGFSAFTRLDIDQMMKEFNFQESGMVDDEQRLQLGKMSGADYVCISKISKEGDAYYIEASLVHIQTGRIDNPGTAFAEGGIGSVNVACQKVAANMVGKKITAEDITIITDGNGSSASGGSGSSTGKADSAYPKVVYNEAYKISILSLTRTGRTLTMYYNVKNEGRYTTHFRKYNATGEGFKLYTEQGDVIEASHSPGYCIICDFHPGITIKKKVVFNDVPEDIKEFSHLVFKTGAEMDQSNGGSKMIEHSIQNLPIQKANVKTASKTFLDRILEQ